MPTYWAEAYMPQSSLSRACSLPHTISHCTTLSLVSNLTIVSNTVSSKAQSDVLSQSGHVTRLSETLWHHLKGQRIQEGAQYIS